MECHCQPLLRGLFVHGALNQPDCRADDVTQALVVLRALPHRATFHCLTQQASGNSGFDKMRLAIEHPDHAHVAAFQRRLGAREDNSASGKAQRGANAANVGLG